MTSHIPAYAMTNTSKTNYAPDRLLSALTQWLSASGDRELSRKLQISPQVLRQIRSGRVSISPSLLLLMADSAGTPVEELRSLLGERRRKARMLGYIKPGAQPSGGD